MNPHHLTYTRLRHEELLAAAATHRLARSLRRPRLSVAPGLRARGLYARLWWASRPRAESWPRALLDA